jgi:TorA maturation chaperone TorD
MAIIIDPPRASKLLSSMYLCKPSREAIIGWRSLLTDDTSIYFVELKSALESIDAASDKILEDVLWDYTRLFIGPYRLPCPPWESVYTSQKKMMMQDAADEAKRAYADFGVAVDEPTVMPDHIGAELNFLSLVFQRASEENGKTPRSGGIAETFLHEHLLKWVPRFTRDMEEAAETILYKALARSTRQMLVEISADGFGSMRTRETPSRDERLQIR